MSDLTIRFLVDQSPKAAFDAIRDVRAWWSAGVEGATRQVGDEFTYRYRELHASTQRLVEVIPEKKLVWLVTGAHLSFTRRPDEWKGTHLRFELSRVKGQTEVLFTHLGLVPAFECYEACSKGWGFYVGESLHALIETGTGKADGATSTRPAASAPAPRLRRA